MSEILLINPIVTIKSTSKKVGEDLFQIPMGIFNIASELYAHNISVKIIDVNSYNLLNDNSYIDTIKKEVKSAKIVGFNVMTDGVKNSLYISKLIKDINPKIKIVFGGVHPTLFPNETIKNKLVDYVVMYEGEQSLIDIYNGSVKNNIITNDRINMEQSAESAWHLLDLKLYMEGNHRLYDRKIKTLAINTSRGCPFDCSFCINNVLPKWRKWSMKSANRVIEEVKYIKEKYNIDMVNFRDENFFLDKKRANDIMTKLKDIDVDWITTIRANSVNEETIKKAKASGCIYLKIGAESGSNEMLKRLRKGITVNDTLNSARILNKYGVNVFYSFMIGLPNETEEQMIETLKLMKNIKKICSNSVFSLQEFRPYPGSKLYEECKAKNFDWIKDKDFITFAGNYYSQFVIPSFKQLLKEKGIKGVCGGMIMKLKWHIKFKIG